MVFTFQFGRRFYSYSACTMCGLGEQIHIKYYALGQTCTLMQSDHDTAAYCILSKTACIEAFWPNGLHESAGSLL